MVVGVVVAGASQRVQSSSEQHVQHGRTNSPAVSDRFVQNSNTSRRNIQSNGRNSQNVTENGAGVKSRQGSRL